MTNSQLFFKTLREARTDARVLRSNLLYIHNPSKIFGLPVEVVCASLCVANSIFQIYCIFLLPMIAAIILEIVAICVALFGANTITSGDSRFIVVYGIALTLLEAPVIASIVELIKALDEETCESINYLCDHYSQYQYCNYYLQSVCYLSNPLKIGGVTAGCISVVTVAMHLLALRSLRAHTSDERLKLNSDGTITGRGNVIFYNIEPIQQEEGVILSMNPAPQERAVYENPMPIETDVEVEVADIPGPSTSSQPLDVLQMQPVDHYPYEKEPLSDPYDQSNVNMPSSSQN